VKPAKLPSIEESDIDFYLNRHLTLASWGFYSSAESSFSDNLRSALMEISTLEECAEEIPSYYLSEYVICSRDSHCSGDSGSLMIDRQSDETFVAVGIASFGIGSCKEDQRSASVFMRISSHIEWIKDHI
jgi:secreted trypsin-like serine protease